MFCLFQGWRWRVCIGAVVSLFRSVNLSKLWAFLPEEQFWKQTSSPSWTFQELWNRSYGRVLSWYQTHTNSTGWKPLVRLFSAIITLTNMALHCTWSFPGFYVLKFSQMVIDGCIALYTVFAQALSWVLHMAWKICHTCINVLWNIKTGGYWLYSCLHRSVKWKTETADVPQTA